MLGWIHVIQEWREWKVRLGTEWQVSSAGAQWLAEEGRDAVSKGCVFGKETKEDQPWEFLGEVKCPVFLWSS